ncbi:MAG: hypothetical protein JST76_06985 [Bacteroidetes bacterium]|nr:hypothetical protein [Bacteroidota bacterium]
MKTLHTLICAISAALILSACSPHNSSDKPATAPIVPVNLIDSIHDPFLRKGIPADSIEMMEVKRVVCGDLPV